eukprot:COSAG06_NODE_5174_length_3662_cov_2.173730_6_plen_58_part_01
MIILPRQARDKHEERSSCGKTHFKTDLSRIFEPFIYKNASFCQDRLGTNIGKALKKDR